jgi:hypothetical protein
VACIIIMNDMNDGWHDHMEAHLPVARGDGFSGPTGMSAPRLASGFLFGGKCPRARMS